MLWMWIGERIEIATTVGVLDTWQGIVKIEE